VNIETEGAVDKVASHVLSAVNATRQGASSGSIEFPEASLIDRLCQALFQTWFARAGKWLALPKQLFYVRLFGAKDIRLGSGNTIKGVKRIKLGRGFRALDQLWLATVERDDAGNRYTPLLTIGNGVSFGYGVHVAATNSVCIGNDVLVGSRVIITDHNHGIYHGETQSSPLEAPACRILTCDAEVIVEDNVWIGDGVAILPGSRVGQGSIIGANSVVNGMIPKFCIAVGNPARPVKVYDFESRSWVHADSGRSHPAEP
jgi:acetyltransferase-like isoleucine patch superfamily enzyme